MFIDVRSWELKGVYMSAFFKTCFPGEPARSAPTEGGACLAKKGPQYSRWFSVPARIVVLGISGVF